MRRRTITLTHTICLQQFCHGYSAISKGRGKVQFKLRGEIKSAFNAEARNTSEPIFFPPGISVSTSFASYFVNEPLSSLCFSLSALSYFLLHIMINSLLLPSLFISPCPHHLFHICLFLFVYQPNQFKYLGPTIHLLHTGMHELIHIITHKSHQPFLFTYTHVFKFKNSIFMKLVFSHRITTAQWASLGGSDGKESACNVGDWGSIPQLGRSPGEGNGYPFQYPCLENSMDREAWAEKL